MQEAYRLLQNEYTQLTDVAERLNELEKQSRKDQSILEYSTRENEQLKSQNEHLLNELARLTQIETRDRTRTIEQADLRRQYDDLLHQYNQLNQQFNEFKEHYQNNQLSYENDMKNFNDEIIRYRLENEQFQSANDLLREERNQMKESHDTILKKRLDEIKYLQIENRDLQYIRQKYNEEHETFQAIDLRKTQLENDLLTMQAVEDRCQDLQTTVERLQTEIQLGVSRSESKSVRDHVSGIYKKEVFSSLHLSAFLHCQPRRKKFDLFSQLHDEENHPLPSSFFFFFFSALFYSISSFSFLFLSFNGNSRENPTIMPWH